MTSTIQTVCCCDPENEYVQFEIAPRCTDNSLGCGCGSSDPYQYRSTDHGCGAVDPTNYECTSTGQTGCSEPGTNDCEPCGAVYLEKNAFKNMVLHTCDGIDWSPVHELIESMDGWWQAGGSRFTTQACTQDSPSTDRIITWADASPCGSTNNLVKVQSDQCLAPVELINSDPRNPLPAGTILSTEQVVLSTTRPRDMTAGNITNLNVDTGDAWFAVVFRVQSGATLGRRRIFDQGDDNFGLILDGTTLKACFGSEANSAQQTSLSTGDWHIVIGKRESGTVSARLNGSDFSTNDVSSSDSISTSDQFKINTIGSGDARFRGQYGDLIVGNGTLDDETVEKLEWYLADKFDLLANLPSGHPYKTSAPTITELTPKEFTFRLSNHVFKINLAGTVVPCKLTGGGCLGPQEYSIGSDCKTITTEDVMKDCAGNVMFYGPSHPSSLNDYGSVDWDYWTCRYRFWVDSDPCLESSSTPCPESCDDDGDEYADNYNYISSEYARGLHYLDCDDCSDCDPPDALGKFLRLSVANCFGNNTYGIVTSRVEWQDPMNLLVGQTNYTNQTRCTKEFDGNPGECCGSDGSSSAPFVGSLNAALTSTCQTGCLNPSFQTINYDSPFDNCIESEYDGFFCNPGLTVNSCCFDDVQPKVTALSVNFGSFELIAPSTSTGHTISVEGMACGSTCALAAGGSGTHICSEDRAFGEGRCGTVVSTLPPTDFDPIRCCTASQDPTPGEGCDDEGYTNCSQIGYGPLTRGLDDQGIGKVNGGSIVILSSDGFSKDGLPANRGLITARSYSADTVADAWENAACAFNSFYCGCPPQNLKCDGYGLDPMQNGVSSVSLDCDDIGDNSPPFTKESIYKVSITVAFGTSKNTINAGGATFVYKKISTSYDASGTYQLDTSLMSGVQLYRYNYPTTITVT